MRRENYLYVGMDLHKETHTAVLINCWNEILRTIEIANKPSEFTKLAKAVNKTAATIGLQPIYGLENAYGHGRALAVWLIERGCVVKDVNPAMAYEQRKSAPTMKKNDAYDAYSVATVLINHLYDLPDAKPQDNHWTLSQLVNHREKLVNDGMRIKNNLHLCVTEAYPSYTKYFVRLILKLRCISGKPIRHLSIWRKKRQKNCIRISEMYHAMSSLVKQSLSWSVYSQTAIQSAIIRKAETLSPLVWSMIWNIGVWL